LSGGASAQAVAHVWHALLSSAEPYGNPRRRLRVVPHYRSQCDRRGRCCE